MPGSNTLQTKQPPGFARRCARPHTILCTDATSCLPLLPGLVTFYLASLLPFFDYAIPLMPGGIRTFATAYRWLRGKDMAGEHSAYKWG